MKRSCKLKFGIKCSRLMMRTARFVCFMMTYLLCLQSFAQWSEPLQLHGRIDNDLSIKTWPSINATEDTIYYAKLSTGGNENICYSYRYNEDQWSEPLFMPTWINTPQREISPSIGPEDSVLYFVSFGQPGGYGSYDIWFTRRDENGQWSEPVNPGPNINSAGEEWGVFISRDGQHLYFSSDRPPQGTGLDILVSEWQGDGWGEAVVLPGQINSWRLEENVTLPSDESFLILTMARFDSTEYDLWRCDFDGQQWSAPQWLQVINHSRNEDGASLTPNGLTIYFASQRNDAMPDNSQIYVSYYTDAVDPRFPQDQRTDEVQVIPNPVTGNELLIQVSHMSMGDTPEIVIHNLMGQAIELTNKPELTKKGTLWQLKTPLPELPAGRYFVSLKSRNLSKVVPFTIQQ